MTTCPGLSPDGPFVTNLLGYVDCQAQTIGAIGYQALAAPGSVASVVLTGLLTLFVALFGYRLLFGQVPDTRAAVLAVVKVGIVLALATSWSGYRTMVYDLTLHGPAELAAAIGGGAALPGAGGGLEAHLQSVDDALTELVRIGTGKPPNTDEIVGPTTQPTTPEQQQQLQQRLQQLGQRPRWDPQRDQQLLGTARTVYLTGTIGSLAAVRLVAGVLLALGPVFALFLLFDATRGVFEGWVRALAGAMLGGVTCAVLLGAELAVIEPWLAAIMADRDADLPTPAVPIELLSLTLVFAVTLVAGLVAAGRIAYGLHIPSAVRDAPARVAQAIEARLAATRAAQPGDVAPAVQPERSRALAISEAVAATQRRETQAVTMGQGENGRRFAERGGNPQTPERGVAATTIQPIGQSARRRVANRVSAGSNRREAL